MKRYFKKFYKYGKNTRVVVWDYYNPETGRTSTRRISRENIPVIEEIKKNLKC